MCAAGHLFGRSGNYQSADDSANAEPQPPACLSARGRADGSRTGVSLGAPFEWPHNCGRGRGLSWHGIGLEARCGMAALINRRGRRRGLAALINRRGGRLGALRVPVLLLGQGQLQGHGGPATFHRAALSLVGNQRFAAHGHPF